MLFPKTGKEIKYNTAVKKGEYTIEYDLSDAKKIRMIPVNKSLFDKIKDENENEYWLLKTSKAHTYAKTNNMIVQKLVYAPNKNMIPIDSVQYNQLINDGYIYDERANLIILFFFHKIIIYITTRVF